MLQELFISKVRVDILKLLLLNPSKSFHVRGIVRRVGVEINAVRRELARLEGIKLVMKRQSGNRLYYTANSTHEFYSELVSLLAKEEGIGKAILSQIKHLGSLKFVCISKDFLRGRASTPLDVDVFIVGEVNETVLSELIKEQEAKYSREINYSVMKYDEFMQRKRQQDNFVTRVLVQSRTMLIGDESEFSALV
jgi:DNA-binding transcriptional ArsR family regulator